MQVDIWSDVVCPFCYIGQTKFEQALDWFAERQQVHLTWKDFLLMPDLTTQPGKSHDQVLAGVKGISVAQAHEMNAQATRLAAQAGLEFHFDRAITGSTFRAHELLQLAKTEGRQQQAELALFRAYFTDGRNVDDVTTLAELGQEIGLDPAVVTAALEAGTFAPAVEADLAEARRLGVRGVPFFVFDGKYAISGAQSPEVFLATLEKAFAEWQAAQPAPALRIIEGDSCTLDGNCT